MDDHAERIMELLHKYEIGFVVGDKDAEEHCNKFLSDIAEYVRREIAKKDHEIAVLKAGYEGAAEKRELLHRQEVAKGKSIIEDLYEDTQCEFDHHGYCQA